MNDTNVPSTSEPASETVLAALSALMGELDSLTPEMRKAAAYVLENPNDVSVSSIREMADAAAVKPNTLVRMARTVGFDGYEDFRDPFRQAVRQGAPNFPDRARWLQSIRQRGELGTLYADMVASALSNIESTFVKIWKKWVFAYIKLPLQAFSALTIGVDYGCLFFCDICLS